MLSARGVVWHNDVIHSFQTDEWSATIFCVTASQIHVTMLWKMSLPSISKAMNKEKSFQSMLTCYRSRLLNIDIPHAVEAFTVFHVRGAHVHRQYKSNDWLHLFPPKSMQLARGGFVSVMLTVWVEAEKRSLYFETRLLVYVLTCCSSGYLGHSDPAYISIIVFAWQVARCGLLLSYSCHLADLYSAWSREAPMCQSRCHIDRSGIYVWNNKRLGFVLQNEDGYLPRTNDLTTRPGNSYWCTKCSSVKLAWLPEMCITVHCTQYIFIPQVWLDMLGLYKM